jgi:hypothetical protein
VPLDAIKEQKEHELHVSVSSPEAGQSHSTRNANKPFENEAKFKYLGMIVENQRCVHGEVRSILNEGSTSTIQFRVFSLPVYLKRKE